jgi:hypothetical protein
MAVDGLTPDKERIDLMYKGLFASIKVELVTTQHFIDYFEMMNKHHPECKTSYADLKSYREFLHWWLRKIDTYRRTKDMDKELALLELPSLSLFEANKPIPYS